MGLDLSGMLICVRCGIPLPPEASWGPSGTSYTSCGTEVPVVRGVPRFVVSDAYAGSFSFKWNRHTWRVLDTFDWYSPKYQSLHTFPEVYRWFRSEELTDIALFDYPVDVAGSRPVPLAGPGAIK
jgi:hypothetical protein